MGVAMEAAAGDDLMTAAEIVAGGIVSATRMRYLADGKLVQPVGWRDRARTYDPAAVKAVSDARPGRPRSPAEASSRVEIDPTICVEIEQDLAAISLDVECPPTSEPDGDRIDLYRAAELLGVAVQTVRRLMNRGRLRRVGDVCSPAGRTCTAVSRAEVEALISARHQTTPLRPAPPPPPLAAASPPEIDDVPPPRRRSRLDEPRPRATPAVIPADFPITRCAPDPALLPRPEVATPASVEEDPRPTTPAERWQQAEEDNLYDPVAFKIEGDPRQVAEIRATMLGCGIVRLASALDGTCRPDWRFVGVEIRDLIEELLGELRVALIDRDLVMEDFGAPSQL
jgi:hypothetical protein